MCRCDIVILDFYLEMLMLSFAKILCPSNFLVRLNFFLMILVPFHNVMLYMSQNTTCPVVYLVLQRDAIIEIFYERHFGQLIDVITSSCSGMGKCIATTPMENFEPSYTKPEVLLSICELLCFCVVHHPHRIK